MCGIAGIATLNGLRPDDPDLHDRMLRALAHRGPDDQHALCDERAAIGARRLSIIDLDTGRQPVGNEDGSIWAVQNGEIYNYVELREELIRRGHRLSSKGDTETIVHLYEEFGPSFVEHLRGMFALAVWDRPKRRLVLARDRLGKKPLYWRLADGRLAFASEMKGLMEDNSAGREVDRTSLALYLQYQYVPSPRSILRGISKLPPASTLVWEGGEAQVERYWHLDYRPKVAEPIEEQRDACLALLRESVRLRLRSDVPVGVFLSGGADSSLVTALMAEASETPVRTYSIGFDEREYDELPYARAIARHFSTVHTEEVVQLDAISLLPALARHYDEPFADSSAIPTFRVAQLAGRELKVVLTGDGGDEAFGGYDRYRFQLAMDAMSVLPNVVHAAAARSAQFVLSRSASRTRLRRRAESWGRLATMPRDERYVELMSIFGPELRRELLRDEAVADQDAYLLAVLRAGPSAGIDHLLHADTLTYLPEDLLVKMDRATMAASLEARAPILDHKVMEFAARLPANSKVRGREMKRILRDVASGLLPPRHLDRPKMGFGVPVGSWFRGALGERFAELVMVPDALSRDHLDQAVARRLLAEHRDGRADHGARLWSLMMFELWARTWLPARAEVAA